jgi:peptidoglycan hydrolase CwlO-like protein
LKEHEMTNVNVNAGDLVQRLGNHIAALTVDGIAKDITIETLQAERAALAGQVSDLTRQLAERDDLIAERNAQLEQLLHDAPVERDAAPEGA